MSAFAFSWATYIMRSFLNCTFFLLVFSFLGEVYPFATLSKERKGQNVVKAPSQMAWCFCFAMMCRIIIKLSACKYKKGKSCNGNFVHLSTAWYNSK